jgi:hypothetical protein
MTKRTLDVTIPNWSMFGVKKAIVNVFQKVINGEFFYYGALLIWLDDGVSDDKYEEKTITLFTDVVMDDSKKCAVIVAEIAATLFEEIGSKVMVFGEENEVIEEFDLNDEEIDLDGINLESYGFVEQEQEKKVIH